MPWLAWTFVGGVVSGIVGTAVVSDKANTTAKIAMAGAGAYVAYRIYKGGGQ